MSADQWTQAGDPDIVSASDETSPLFTREEFDYFDAQQVPNDPGAIIDGQIVDDEPRRSRLKSEPSKMLERDASSNIPKIDEWMHFFSRVLIRGGTDYYIDWAFRGIDEDLLSDREVERIKLDDEERDRIARPFAEYSNKSKFMRKHGRMIIASADSIDAIMQLGLWFSRVNRIASKYQPFKGKKASRQPVRASQIFIPAERQPNDSHLGIRREDFDVSSEPSAEAQQNGHEDGWRPNIAGQVYNPNLG